MTPTAPSDRQPAYDAVYAVIRQYPVTGLAGAMENARVWRAVEAALDAMQAAGRLLPGEGDRREEWGIWWHSGDSDGIVLAEAQIGSRERAERRAKERIGEYGITRYTLRRCEHRVWADGTTLIGPWTSVEEPA